MRRCEGADDDDNDGVVEDDDDDANSDDDDDDDDGDLRVNANMHAVFGQYIGRMLCTISCFRCYLFIEGFCLMT
jgi:hypothetical protein